MIQQFADWLVYALMVLGSTTALGGAINFCV